MICTWIAAQFAEKKRQGFERCTYKAHGLTLRFAPDGSINSAHVYVKRGREYLGKISRSGEFRPVSGGLATLDGLASIESARDPAPWRNNRRVNRCPKCGTIMKHDGDIKRGVHEACARRALSR